MLSVSYIESKIRTKNKDQYMCDKKCNLLIDSVDFDARRLTGNSFFVVLTTGKVDGHLYISQAIQNGAVAILCSNESMLPSPLPKDVTFFVVEDTLRSFQALAKAYREDLAIPVIAITGSNGKTTTKDIVRDVLSVTHRVHATEGNFNNHIGVPLTILRAKKEHEVLILEMGMNHAGELDVLGIIASPDYVVITNIGESHIEHLGSKLGIAHAKGELLPHIRTGGTAIIPWDCGYREILATKTTEQVVFTQVGSNPTDIASDKEIISAQSMESSSLGTSFTIHANKSLFPVQSPLFGAHNVANTLVAVFLGQVFGLDRLSIQQGLKRVSISSMRFERLNGKNNSVLINDAYNASPTSMQKSAETFIETFTENRRVLVLGDMFELGADKESLHRLVGEYLNQYAAEIEFLITVGEDTRYISGVFRGRKRHFETKEEASAFIRSFLHEDFALFFKASRGMRLETIVQSCIG